MHPRIAIPVPHSDQEYANRSLPQYERAVEMAEGQPVRIPLDVTDAEARKLMESCHAVLLPGSKADVDPAKYAAPRHPKTAADDQRRYAVDALLLDHAFEMQKPILGICYGLQSLNVYCKGTLIQDIESAINHAAGRNVAVAHDVSIENDSKLARILGVSNGVRIPVNSSHHQSTEEIGKDLRIAAQCPEDGIIEAIEGTSHDHFLVAVQWHPERSVDQDEPSRAIFAALVAAAREKR
ncbi:MAG: gamma-glutamyl-gamma-aminobutyrate hydrolase family protein [Acidobacteriaceae bacterium]|nr:gamma-glutamyl-gamma-aminobutyrate hydrolase family protein [Acidobacteriaceae bacterium]